MFFHNRSNAIGWAENQGWPMTRVNETLIAWDAETAEFRTIVQTTTGIMPGAFIWKEI